MADAAVAPAEGQEAVSAAPLPPTHAGPPLTKRNLPSCSFPSRLRYSPAYTSSPDSIPSLNPFTHVPAPLRKWPSNPSPSAFELPPPSSFRHLSLPSLPAGPRRRHHLAAHANVYDVAVHEHAQEQRLPGGRAGQQGSGHGPCPPDLQVRNAPGKNT